MSAVTNIKNSKLHFLKRRESSHTLSNGWVVTMRALSGMKKAELEAMLFEVEGMGDKQKVQWRFDRQGEAYAAAIAAALIRIEDGDHIIDGKGQPVFTAEEIGELDKDIFTELRQIIDGDEGKKT